MAMILAAGIILSCVLQLGAAQRKISIILQPPKPLEGQNVTLSVQGGPAYPVVCGWGRRYQKRSLDNIREYYPTQSPQQRNDLQQSRWHISSKDCSLTIRNLEKFDEGGYAADITANSTGPEEPKELYEGYVYLRVFGNDTHSHAAGLRYSTGVIAGALLGFFAWTDTLTSIFYGLCSTLSLPGRLQ